MQLHPTRRLCLLFGLLLAGPASAAPGLDWRDQVIYFAMTDRFDNGDRRNDDQGAGEFDPARASHYSGGDLAGLRRRLDYIQGLGATALWITPPVANQWLDPWSGYSGYHGYWASHFKRVDPHLGTLADYRGLARALHRRGMSLVQDIVVNHSGNFFDYQGGWDPADPARHYRRNEGSRPTDAPTQPPFHLNDPRRAADRAAAVYHWTPPVRDYTDPEQEQTFQMSGLDDLNTGNPVVRRALRDSYGFWLREVGVDAFRVDTAFYVQPAFFDDFLHARDPAAPGLMRLPQRRGPLHVFGEGFGIDRPFDDTQARRIERYMTGADGRPLLPGMLNFPLYGAFGDVFARGRPTAELGHRITQTTRLHARAHLMPTFVDNHDVDRFLAGGSHAALRQALLAMFTLPGIPVVYYGTEQGFTQPRAAMFAGGWGSGGRDHFDTAAPLYRDIAAMAALRRTHRLLSRGVPTLLHASAAGPGAIAWRMDHEGEAALVLFNSADEETLVDNLHSGAPAGTVLRGLYGLHGKPTAQVVGADGRLTLRLPARSGMVWAVGGRLPLAPAAASGLTLDPLPELPFNGDFSVSGRADAPFLLVTDGDLARAQPVRPGADGRWSASVDTSAMSDPALTHRLTAWDAAGGANSATRLFRVDRPWRLLADVADPEGDDHGPDGRYLYPTDPGWGANRQLDLRRVRVSTSGGALELELTTTQLTTSWNPANGFDHVLFTVFIELPGLAGGSRLMPLQHAELPGGMRWHRRLRVGGWSNALFSDSGAGADAEGQPVTPGAALRADPAARTLSLRLPAAALGNLASLRGARIYVTTWDYDGGYRALTPAPGSHHFGGGSPAGARVMDDSVLIELP